MVLSTNIPGSITRSNKPFPHFFILNFYPHKGAELLLKILKQQQFSVLNSDLFTFLQTKDLAAAKEFKTITEKLLSTEFLTTIESQTNTKLSSTKLDLFGSIYKNTHHLLPHDDQLEGRAVAFIYYLSTLKEKDGGALALYASRNGKPTTVATRIQPTFNTFVFFPVTTTSFHEVEEVITDTERVALSGWFYGR